MSLSTAIQQSFVALLMTSLPLPRLQRPIAIATSSRGNALHALSGKTDTFAHKPKRTAYRRAITRGKPDKMSTRCNVIVKDSFGDQIMFYRHSDGYPEGVARTLGEFLALVKANKLRDNAEQSAGWLIVLGYEEYAPDPERGKYDFGNDLAKMRANTEGTNLSGWKVGAYEPCTKLHRDIDYLYEVDLQNKTLKGWRHNGERKGKCVTAELNAEIAKLDE